jgi:hypothetical protein
MIFSNCWVDTCAQVLARSRLQLYHSGEVVGGPVVHDQSVEEQRGQRVAEFCDALQPVPVEAEQVIADISHDRLDVWDGIARSDRDVVHVDVRSGTAVTRRERTVDDTQCESVTVPFREEGAQGGEDLLLIGPTHR